MAAGTWESQLTSAQSTRERGSASGHEVGDQPPKPAYYYEGLENLEPSVSKFFVGYAGLQPEAVVPHIELTRQKAYNVDPYPCIGAYRFLHNTIAESPFYQPILDAMKTDPSARFLDLACCLGQEMRQLAFDGIPSSQLIGTDLKPHFFDLGYDLFRDRDSFQGRFFKSNVLDEDDTELRQLEGTIDFIWVGAFLHLFTYDVQLKVLVRMMKLLKPTAGVKILGRQVGSREPGTRQRKSSAEMFFQHDVDSLKKQFNEAAELTGTRWEVDGELLDWEEWQHGQNLGMCGKEFNADTVDLRFWAERLG